MNRRARLLVVAVWFVLMLLGWAIVAGGTWND